MNFLKKLRKFVGYIVVIISIILGITGISVAEWDQPFVSIFLYLLLGVLPFCIGLWIIGGYPSLKENAWGKFRFYTALTVFAPLTFQLVDYLIDEKGERVSSPTDIFVDSAGIPIWLTYVVIFAGVLAFISFLGIYVTWFQMEKHVYIMFIGSLIICTVVPLFTKNDYRAIREEGLFVSSQGSNESIPWANIEKVNVVGEISEGLGKSSSSYFKWDFIFYVKDGKEERFGPFAYSEYNLHASKDIKNAIMENRVSMSLDGLSEKEWSYVEIDMEYEEGDPNDFYEFFQYDPKTKEYYDIPYK